MFLHDVLLVLFARLSSKIWNSWQVLPTVHVSRPTSTPAHQQTSAWYSTVQVSDALTVPLAAGHATRRCVHGELAGKQCAARWYWKQQLLLLSQVAGRAESHSYLIGSTAPNSCLVMQVQLLAGLAGLNHVVCCCLRYHSSSHEVAASWPVYLQDGIIHKLQLLNYEREFCRRK